MALLSNQIIVKRHTLIPDALECFHRLKEDTPQVTRVAADYQAWQNFLKEQQVDVPDLEITHMIP